MWIFAGTLPKIYSVNLRIQSKCGKIRTKKNPYLDTFQAVLVLDDYKIDYEYLIKNNGTVTMGTKRLQTLASETFKTIRINHIKPLY